MARESSIAAGTVIRGRIQAESDLEVLGQVEGSIGCKGALELGEGALLKSSLEARRIVVRGTVAGDIRATESLVLEPGARVVGDIAAPSIGIRPGALVRGHVHTGAPGAALGAGRADARAQRPAERPAVAAPKAVASERVAPKPVVEAQRVAAKPAPEPARAAPKPAQAEAKIDASKARTPAGAGSDGTRRAPPPPVVPRTPNEGQKRMAGQKAETHAAPSPVVPSLARRSSKAMRRSSGR
jgi:cytoskeletal protein CcmA (bactofilin family)